MITDEELTQLIAETEDTALQARLKEILQMPPEQREAAIGQLTRAYEPEREDLRSELERNFALATQASPEGQMSAGNQFGYYVGASPLEHLASGMMKYKAGKGMRENRGALEELAGQESDAQKRVLMAHTASILRGQPKKFWEDEEEELPFWMRKY